MMCSRRRTSSLPRTLIAVSIVVSIVTAGCVTATDADTDPAASTTAPRDDTATTSSEPQPSEPRLSQPEAPELRVPWPLPRRGHAMVADGAGRLVVFGGRSLAGTARTYLDDTWLYDTTNGAWTEVRSPDGPTLRSEYAMGWSGVPGTVVLFGGYTGDRFTYPGTWTFDGDAWTRVAPTTAPTPRAGAVLAWDPTEREVVMFGGAEEPTVAELPTDETWTFDPNSREWTRRRPPSSPRPMAEGHPTLFELALVHDTRVGRSILLIGGDETWSYDAGADVWERRSDPGLEADFMVAAAYDERLGRVVAYGGGPTSLSDETWLYDHVTDEWERVDTPNNPGRIGDHAMAYDPVTERTYLYGGGEDLLPLDGVGDVSSELWVFDGSDWTRLGPPASPAP